MANASGSSPKMLSQLRGMLAFRFAWKLLIVVIFAIIVVEIGILIPSYNNHRASLLSDLQQLGATTSKVALPPGMQQNDPDLTRYLNRIIDSDSRILGLTSLGADGRVITSVGEAINQMPESFLSTDALLTDNETRYVVFYPQATSDLPVGLIMQFDASHIGQELNAYIIRIAGLVIIIAGFAGLIVFLYTTRSLLATLADIRISLQQAKENPAIADNFTILHDRHDELGETTDLLNSALIEIAENHRSSERDQEQRLRDFADSGSDWFWEMDANLRFTYFSEKFEAVSGVKPEMLIGKTRRETPIPGVDAKAWKKHLEDLDKRRPFREFIHPRTKDDGIEVWLSISGIPCYNQDNEFTGFRGVGSDITESVKTQIELKNAKDLAEKANRAKTNFLATMSHEIRTPMNGIIGMTDLMQDTQLDQEQAKYVSTIKSSGKALMTILNDILDYSKLEAQRISLETIPFGLTDIVEGVVRILEPGASQKKLSLTYDVAEDIEYRLLGDPGRIRQVLLNLTGNAIKFTENGSVDIRVLLLDSTNSQQSIRVEVTDTGIGIASDAVDKLFDSFTQADESTTRKYGGTGLGLAISRKIIETMQGKIGVTSEMGKGSQFWFEITLPAADDFTQTLTNIDTSVLTNATVACDATGAQLRVLVVDDVPVNLLVARNMLEKMGFNVSEAKNGVEAIDNFLHNRYDLILMDLQMPEMDGFEATRKIRSQEKGADIPIIAITAATQDEDRQMAIEVGMDAYINKPFVASQLQECLSRYFSFELIEEQLKATADQDPRPGSH